MACILYLVLALCLNRALTFAAQRDEIDRLTEKEIYRIFHTSRAEVPDYKTVVLKSFEEGRTRRDLRRVVIEVDTTKILLNLYPVKTNLLDGTSVWTVVTDRQSSARHRYQKSTKKMDNMFYEDHEKMAMLLIYYNDDYIYYDGIIGENNAAKVVRGFPEHWGWIDPTKYTTENNTHLLFDVNLNKNPTEAVGDILYAAKTNNTLDILYPKLLIVATSDYFRKVGEDFNEMIKYINTFWNAVDMKYSKLTNPAVKIIITGIIIAKDDTALPYVYDSRIPNDMNKLNVTPFFNGHNDYFQQTFHSLVDFKNYDAIIALTSLDTGSTAGRAYIGSICQNEYNIGFVHDDGNFGGIQAATHELGHLLNITHDGYGDAKSCNRNPEPNVGTIMSPVVENVDKLVWSECSKRTLQNFASSKAAECLKSPSRRRSLG